jgi:hypothetical protein
MKLPPAVRIPAAIARFRVAALLALGLLPGLSAAQPVSSHLRESVLTRPVNVSVASDAAAAESQRIALEAARQDAEIQRRLLKRQLALGTITSDQYAQGMGRYERAIHSYRELRPGRGDRPTGETAVALEQQLVDFTAGGDGLGAPSILREATLKRGERGEVRVDRDSLQRSVDTRVELIRASLPADEDPAPALAYLDFLQRKSQARLASAHVDGTVDLALAADVAEPVQEYQMMMSGPGWQVDLQLRSTPAQAAVQLRALGDFQRDFTTDTSRPIMRGLFDYTVRKQGYKTIEGTELDLVFTRGEFSCVLVPEDSAQEPLPCNIE